MDNTKDILYNISRIIQNDNRNKYTYFASNFNKYNYRVINSTELAVKGKDLELPIFIRNFVKDNSEVLLIFNNIAGKSKGILFRAIDKKEFCNYGFGKGMLYGLGDLDPDFKYGDPIILVEGAIDRDVCATFLSKNCLGLLTSRLSNNQIEVITRLTNKFILLLDNDEAGRQGENNIERKLLSRRENISVFRMESKRSDIKDLGDLIDLYRYKNIKFNDIIVTYRCNILEHGGKLC